MIDTVLATASAWAAAAPVGGASAVGGPLELSDPAVEFGFARPFPAWVWAIALSVIAVVVWRAYSRLEGPAWARAALAAVRGVLLAALLFLVSGPQLIKPNEIDEQDWVLFLVDRSASMQIPDAAVGGDGASGVSGARVTRDEQARRALESARPAVERLAAERKVVWLGFDAAAYDLPANPSSAAPLLAASEGARTDIERAIDQALRRAAARPISGIVLLSDGRASSEPSRALMRRLEAERVPVFALPLGDSAGISDVGVRRVEAPRLAFALDAVPVEAEIERVRAGGSVADDRPVVVELVDTATGEVLDTRTVRWPEAVPVEAGVSSSESLAQAASVRLTARAGRVGASRWSVRIRPDEARPDLIESNDALAVGIELVDRPLRVLYIDGYPRWEYRFVKNLLVREPSVLAATLLLSPRHRYIQEGSITLEALPRSPEEWSQFDLFIVGDVWPGVLTSEQLFQMRERVAVGGAGLVWIAGESHTPGAWRSTPLADLLPFSLAADAAGSGGESLPTFERPVVVFPTPEAERLGVLRLSDGPVEPTEVGVGAGAEDGTGLAFWPPILSDPSAGWNAFYWAQRIDRERLKPTVEVLAVARPVDEVGAGPSGQGRSVPGDPALSGSPLVMSMRYGAGRVMYVATDEVWRWRYARGEPFTERFYIQLFRLLGREALNRSGKPALLEVSPVRADVQAPVRIRLTLLEQSLVDADPRSIRARVFRVDGPGSSRPAGTPGGAPGDAEEMVEVTLTPEMGADAGGRGAGGGAPSLRAFSAAFVPQRAGEYRVEVVDPLLTSRVSDLSTRLEVIRSDDELRRPAADHGLLARLADASGGRLLAAGDLGQLDRLLPNRRIKLAGEPEIRTLWDTPWALLLIVGLCTAEWVGRRLIRLA